MVTFPISEGTLPVKLLGPNNKTSSCLHLNKVDEIVPVKQLSISKQILKFAKWLMTKKEH
jgi:hypothetical protein